MHPVWFAKPLEKRMPQIRIRQTYGPQPHNHLLAHRSQAISNLVVPALRSQRGTPHNGLHSRRSPYHPA